MIHHDPTNAWLIESESDLLLTRSDSKEAIVEARPTEHNMADRVQLNTEIRCLSGGLRVERGTVDLPGEASRDQVDRQASQLSRL